MNISLPLPLQFQRTECACRACTACCYRQPGALAPGDFERIATFLNLSPDMATHYFWASGGAMVMNTTTGRQFRIGTITPRVVRKRCVFLDDQQRCSIHAVAPFGCAYFDTHQTAAVAMVRGTWLARATQDADYQRMRATLPFATSYKPIGY